MSLRPRTAILGDLIKEYNTKEKVSLNKIHPDEERAIKFLAKRDDETLREVKLAWAQERVPFSAVPMTLLASPFLDEGRELPITEKDNSRWHTILQPTEAACRCTAQSRLHAATQAHRACNSLACKHYCQA